MSERGCRSYPHRSGSAPSKRVLHYLRNRCSITPERLLHYLRNGCSIWIGTGAPLRPEAAVVAWDASGGLSRDISANADREHKTDDAGQLHRDADSQRPRCTYAVVTVTVVSVTVGTGNFQPVPDDLLGMPIYVPARDPAAQKRRIDLSEAGDLLARLDLVRPRRSDLLGHSSRVDVRKVHSRSGAATGGR